MRNPLIQLTSTLLIALALTSCITTLQTNYLQVPKNTRSTFNDSSLYEDYRLKEGDRLYIKIYSTDTKTNTLINGSENTGMQMLSGSSTSTDLYTYYIKADGNIQFPIIGEVQLKGKTLRESKKTLEESLKPLLNRNSVDVRMIGKSFSIIGAGKSGKYVFPKEKINIFQALALVGDVGLYTDRSKIRILRQTQSEPLIKTFDIRNEDIINSEFYYLEPDDIIFLQPMKSQFFGVTTFWNGVSTIITTISFGTGIYGLLAKPTNN